MTSGQIFRPRRGPIVAGIVATACLLGFSALLLSVGASPNWKLADKVLSCLFLIVGLFLLYRQASVRATWDDDGIVIRNFLVTTKLVWAQIISVRFGPGRPWVRLDLSDGTEIAVMAIQAADGRYATKSAARLAQLVADHEVTGSD